MKTKINIYNIRVMYFQILGGIMILAGIIIGILGGIYVISFAKVNRWYNSIFTSGSLSGAESFYVICPKCSNKVKRVKSASQICSTCQHYF